MGQPEPERRFGAREALVQAAIAGACGFVAFLTASANIGTPEGHRDFTDFFAASAAVIAALLIALSIEARAVFPLKAYAAVTPACLAIGGISSVAALSPSLPDCAYKWLLAFTVGGGLGGLVAVVWAAKMLLERDVEAHRLEQLLAAGVRALEDKERREKAKAEGADSAKCPTPPQPDGG